MTLSHTLRSRKALLVYVIAGSLFVLGFLLDVIILPLVIHSRSEVSIPDVVRRPVAEACALLEEADLQPVVADTMPNPAVPEGRVFIQNPPARTLVREGRNVYLTVSSGMGEVQVPNLRGRSLRDAIIALEQSGLRAGMVTYTDSDLAPDLVLSQSVRFDRLVKRGSAVDLTVSSGNDTTRSLVPELLGLSLEQAIAQLQAADLVVGNVNYEPHPGKPVGTVISQMPREGDRVRPRSLVDVVLSK